MSGENIFTVFDGLHKLQQFVADCESLYEIRCHPRHEQFCRTLFQLNSRYDHRLTIDRTTKEDEIEFIFDDHTEIASLA